MSDLISFVNDSGLGLVWSGDSAEIYTSPAAIQKTLANLSAPCHVVRMADGRIGVTNGGGIQVRNGRAAEVELLASTPPVPLSRLGDPAFLKQHGVKFAYTAGAMANGIASEELVIALGRAGLLCSFGAAGLVPSRVRSAIQKIQAALPDGPYAVNLIHSPSEENLERSAVDMFLEFGVRTVEASAFLALTPHIVRYRVAGLSENPDGSVKIENKVIAKISRREVAIQFMQPAPERILNKLLQDGLITQQQALLAARVPMADDVTVEADSGGHTDNRPLVSLLPSIIALRDEIQAQYGFAQRIRVGAAGGISTPESALAAFAMGAAYLVTGSINQGCVEAGASAHTKALLAKAEMADVAMAPAADMFEMGVEVQVLKRGTLFAMRAKKLYELYKTYDGIDDIPSDERAKLEKTVFRQPLESIWASCVSFFNERDPHQLARAQNNPKRKMALIFRWYLGLSSRWSNVGEKGREIDYQIWCGQSMGAFNDWVRGSYLEHAENRKAVDVAYQIMNGAAYLSRLQHLQLSGVVVDGSLIRPKIEQTQLATLA